MPLESTLSNATCVLKIEYSLPEKKDLAKDFRSNDGQLNYKKETEATIQMVFFGKYKIAMPTDKISDSSVLESQAYLVLKQNFYELVKNSIDAEARTLELVIFKGKDGEVELVIGDKQGQGFRGGKYGKYFLTQNTLLDFNIIAEGVYKLPTEKKKGTSLGGAGKGLVILNESLTQVGGSLLLQATPEYSAILRLKSARTLENEKKLSKIMEVESVDDADFSTAKMLNQIQLAYVRRKQVHFDFSTASHSGSNSGSETSPDSKWKDASENEMLELCSALQPNSLFSPASTTEEEGGDEEEELSMKASFNLGSPSD